MIILFYFPQNDPVYNLLIPTIIYRLRIAIMNIYITSKGWVNYFTNEKPSRQMKS